METTERKYPSKYELLVKSHMGLVDYVSIINVLLNARRTRQWAKESGGFGPLEAAIEFDLIQVHGARQTGRTLAIHEMATLPTDLILLKDLMTIKTFQNLQYHHSDAVIARPHRTLLKEWRASPEEIYRLKETGDLFPVGSADFVPERIFINDAYYHFKGTASARSIFRWAQARYGTTPVIIAL